MGQYSFLQADFPEVYGFATKALNLAYADPRTSCFYCFNSVGAIVNWLYSHDSKLKLSTSNVERSVSSSGFISVVGENIFNKMRLVVQLGYWAIWTDQEACLNIASLCLEYLFEVSYWLLRTYGRPSKLRQPPKFLVDTIPKKRRMPENTKEELRELETRQRQNYDRLFILFALRGGKEHLETMRNLQPVVIYSGNDTDFPLAPSSQNYGGSVEKLLGEAGWHFQRRKGVAYSIPSKRKSFNIRTLLAHLNNAPLNRLLSKFFPECGSYPTVYFLLGDDGKPLAILVMQNEEEDHYQTKGRAVAYADRVAGESGQRPIIFYTHRDLLWLSDGSYSERPVRGFYKKNELERLLRRGEIDFGAIVESRIDTNIAESYHQTRAIRELIPFLDDTEREPILLCMAAGSGKTRTAIALIELLVRHNRVKRVLFLGQHSFLVCQAINSFKEYLPQITTANLLQDGDGGGEVLFCTYEVMKQLIEKTRDGERIFGVGHFDLIVADDFDVTITEGYANIFHYFDAQLIGLSSIPKELISLGTDDLFHDRAGFAINTYSLQEAIGDGFLIPFKNIPVPSGCRWLEMLYGEGWESQKEEWQALAASGEDSEFKTHQVFKNVEARVNQWLSATDNIDRMLAHLMEQGLKVARSKPMGKTIIFARDRNHAEKIQKRFQRNYPRYGSDFALAVTPRTPQSENVLANFREPDKAPRILISAGMLETGLDVPEIVNLVFFKPVLSKARFWQMVARATRRCPDLFGSGEDKQCFYLFDYCQNLDFFGAEKEWFDASLSRVFLKESSKN
ncbi:MAG: hypothetical protein N5P05_004138 (plasmid) [Chroococcopsis gigantea SAG 12.99]|jgi:type I restriction enzyme R subunit|nr:hypothetical protein [Chroococcopsis gigantea SAG 12.99]